MMFTCGECERRFRTSIKRKKGICPKCYYRLLMMEDYDGKTKRKNRGNRRRVIRDEFKVKGGGE